MGAAAAKSLRSGPTLSDLMDCSLQGSSIHGIFQARILEWGAIAFSNSLRHHHLLPKWLHLALFVVIVAAVIVQSFYLELVRIS